MPQITEPLPEIGERNEFADPKTRDLLSRVKTVVNGQLDTDNLAPGMLDVAAWGDVLQRGVVGASDLQVTAGTGLAVSVAGGTAWVTSTSTVLTRARRTSSTTVSLTAAHATLPRVDRIVATLVADGEPSVGVLTGTPTSGATIDNLTGAAAVPVGSLLLADVLVAATATAPTTIRDRRSRARGQFFQMTSGSVPRQITGVGSSIIIGAFGRRFECVGNTFLISLRCGRLETAGTTVELGFTEDPPPGGSEIPVEYTVCAFPAGYDSPVSLDWLWTPTAGSHGIVPVWHALVAGQTAVITRNLQYAVREVLWPNSSNGTTYTTG